LNDLDVVIVGAGPAGCAAALRLLQIQPRLAGRILLLDRARFPRPKLCGGGVTRRAELALRRLGVDVDVSGVPVTSASFHLPSRVLTIRSGPMWPGHIFRVVNRASFDHELLKAADRRGALVHQEEAVTSVSVAAAAATVSTTNGAYRTRVVLAADGANSLVRRCLDLNSPRRLGAATEMLVPALGVRSEPAARAHATFDFAPALLGMQGYYWEFPTVVGGAPMTSCGVADARIFEAGERTSIRSDLVDRVSRRAPRQAHARRAAGAPMRWFDPRARHSGRRALFVGDAAGSEPLLDEGISTALELGIFAADAAIVALAADDFSFAGYDEMLRRSGLGRSLALRLAIARRFYAHPTRWQYIPLALPSRRFAYSLSRILP
jgi:flavin-dependent dehydrogenase